MLINTLFPNAKGFATYENAYHKLAKVLGDNFSFNSNDKYHSVIIRRDSDNRYIPVVIMGPGCQLQPFALAHNGIAVTNL